MDRPPTTEDRQPPSPLAPLRQPLFRSIWIASLASNLGTWLQNVGAAWLMTELSTEPAMVALVQAATSLPVFFLAIPAGALADIIDRRQLLVIAQTWMFAAALALSILTFSGALTAPLLLLLTAALGIGFATNAPAWQAVVPELVPRDQLRAAIALNSASMNASRAIGPALGGFLVAAAGAGAAFLLNALSFVGVIVVLLRWQRRPEIVSDLPSERMWGAIRAGLRFVRHSPDYRIVLLRAAAFISGAGGLWALLPALAKEHKEFGPTGYGILLGCLGAGAVAATFAMPSINRRFGTNLVVAGGTLIFGSSTAIVSLVDTFWLQCLVLIPAGSAWLGVLTNLNATAQSMLPGWVRARGLAVYLLTIFGGMGLSSVAWGFIANSVGVDRSLLMSAVWTGLGVFAAVAFPISVAKPANFEPSHHWPHAPVIAPELAETGPVLITVEYRVPPEKRNEFTRAIAALERSRRRGGAVRWGVFRDATDPERYIELISEESWLDHLRRHERISEADRLIQQAVHACHVGPEPPKVTHWLNAAPPSLDAPPDIVHSAEL